MEGWKRSWWIALTLVPFGWLAFAAFWFAGWRAERRDWLGWAAFYFVVYWGGTVVASVEQLDYGVRQAGGMVIFLGMPFPLVHALLIRRAYLEAAVERVAPVWRERSFEPEGWKRLRKGGGATAAWMAVCGAAMAIGGGASVARREPAGGMALAMGVALLMTAPLFVPRYRLVPPVVGSVPGTAEAGLAFRYSLARRAVVLGGVGAFAIAMAALATWPEELAPGPATRPFGIVAAAVAAAAWLGMVRNLRDAALFLTASGIRNGGARRQTFVPWHVVEGVRASEGAVGEPFIALDVSDLTAIETSGFWRLVMRSSRRSFGDVTYSTRLLRTEPSFVLATIRHYWEHAEERGDLATERSLETFDELVRGA